ncbi:MAG: insulinase family protein [Alphaproteobacteria bacterium]|nr:MAG: insulinase family protein [Alphaproteobacteria bacterium]
MLRFARTFVAAALMLPALTITATVPEAQAQTIQRVVSPSGIVAWLIRDTSVPLVAMEVSFAGGGVLDPAGREGLSRLATGLLDEGAGERDDQAYASALEDLSARLGFGSTLDSASVSLRALSETFGSAVDLAVDALVAPRFDAAAIERVRRQVLVGLQREQEDPATMANRAFFRDAFGTHPYARGSRGTPQAIAAVTRDDLLAWTRAQFTRDAMTIGVAGDITPEALANLLEASFGRLPATGTRPPVTTATVAAPAGVRIIDMQVPQSTVVFGHQGIARSDPDWYAATVVNYILGGGGFTSRLTEEVREKRGLTYGISTGLAGFQHANLLMGQSQTDNASAAEVVRLITGVWRSLATDGPTDAEVEGAKSWLTGSFPLRMDSTASIARLLVGLQLDGLGQDYLERRTSLIAAVTPADVRRVAARLLTTDQLSVVIAGRPVGITAGPLPR